MSKGIKRMYLLLLTIAGVLILTAGIGENGKRIEPNIMSLKPDKVVQEGEYSKSYYFDVGTKSLGGQGIAFFTNHQNVTLYCNGARFYELLQVDSPWGHTTGSVWNFVHLPYEATEVRIVLEQCYESYAMDDFHILAGNDREIYVSLLKDSAFAMACSIIILAIGVALFVIWMVVRKRTTAVSNVFYLALLSVLFGLWSFNETVGATILFKDRVACSFAAFVLLKLLSPTLVLFAREFAGTPKGMVWEVFSRFMVVEAVVTVSMHMVGIMDLKETVLSTHIILIVSMIYTIGIVVVAFYKRQITEHVKVYIFAGIVVVIAAVAVFINYYIGGNHMDVAGRFGFFIFALLASSQTALHALKMMEKGKYAAIYEEMAITDSLTGLYNRNAYQIDTGKIEELTGFLILTFDLNDLKICNDTKGHTQGDHYIVTAAKMIERLLAPYGRCYRIGGDEFCAIVRNGTTCPVDDLLLKLEMEQIKYNAGLTSDGYPIRIAAGYAMYDAELDADIEEMRSRADTNMYRNKKQIKEANQEAFV